MQGFACLCSCIWGAGCYGYGPWVVPKAPFQNQLRCQVRLTSPLRMLRQVYDEPCALSGLDGKLDEISLKIDALAEVVRGWEREQIRHSVRDPGLSGFPRVV